jgi:hypothetical protein
MDEGHFIAHEVLPVPPSEVERRKEIDISMNCYLVAKSIMFKMYYHLHIHSHFCLQRTCSSGCSTPKYVGNGQSRTPYSL